jgi:GTPase Era involved in 16S rRNA processing
MFDVFYQQITPPDIIIYLHAPVNRLQNNIKKRNRKFEQSIPDEYLFKIQEKKNGILYIKARILTTNDRHKKMLIGANARKIKEIGSYARKEIALSTNKKVFLDLTVEKDPHWQEAFFN